MKALILFSGGQDSTTCLYWAKQKFKEIEAVTIFYGQRHAIEVQAAEKICSIAEVPLTKIDLSPLFEAISDSSLIGAGGVINKEHRLGKFPASFVPGRNIILLTAASMLAVKKGISNVVTGVCQTDYSGYPDCRDNTIKSLQITLSLGMGYDIVLHAPLMWLTKAATVDLAVTLPGCWGALAHSHTCYEGLFPPCGKCPSCILRAKGFAEARKIDPLLG